LFGVSADAAISIAADSLSKKICLYCFSISIFPLVTQAACLLCLIILWLSEASWQFFLENNKHRTHIKAHTLFSDINHSLKHRQIPQIGQGRETLNLP
jgi:hypothetical protein